MDISLINKLTIVLAIIIIAIVLVRQSPEVSFISALFGWLVVITSQLNIIVLRNKK